MDLRSEFEVRSCGSLNGNQRLRRELNASLQHGLLVSTRSRAYRSAGLRHGVVEKPLPLLRFNWLLRIAPEFAETPLRCRACVPDIR
jgi:hypothetical protein